MKKNFIFFVLFLCFEILPEGTVLAHTGEGMETPFIDALVTEHAFQDRAKVRIDFEHRNRAEFEQLRRKPNEEGETEREDKADVSVYSLETEIAVTKRLSVVGKAALIEANPVVLPNTAGIGDIEFGAKYLTVVSTRHEFIGAVQLTVSAPTGNERHGLGEGRTALEPSVLIWKGLNGFSFQGEYQLDIPLGAGTIPTAFVYNMAAGFTTADLGNPLFRRLTPLFEISGKVPLNGSKGGENMLTFIPGIRIDSLWETELGFGIQFPIGAREEEEARIIASVVKHF